jgi:hypothetical protein
MTGDCHVRICGSPGVRFPGPPDQIVRRNDAATGGSWLPPLFTTIRTSFATTLKRWSEGSVAISLNVQRRLAAGTRQPALSAARADVQSSSGVQMHTLDESTRLLSDVAARRSVQSPVVRRNPGSARVRSQLR